MAEALPESLLSVARVGPYAFEFLTRAKVWEQVGADARLEVSANLGLSVEELGTIVGTEAIYSRRLVLAANAVLVAGRQVSDSLGDEWEALMTLRDKLSDDELSRIAPSAVESHRVFSSSSAKESKNYASALAVFDEYGLEWNEEKRRATYLKDDGHRPKHRPLSFFAEVAIALFIEWYGVARPVSKNRVEPISRVLGWFFQPELVGRAQKRIRDHLFPSAARKVP